MKVEKTDRGFEIIRFEDHNGTPCTLQQSSRAITETPGSSAVWLGTGDHNRMHLEMEQVKELVTHLQWWIDNCSFRDPLIPE